MNDSETLMVRLERLEADAAKRELRLQELEDREAIRELIYFKARATDRADAVAEERTLTFDQPYQGISASARALQATEAWSHTHHQIGNILIRIDGDEAATEHYCTAFHETLPTSQANLFTLSEDSIKALGGRLDVAYNFLVGLRYIQKLKKRNGEWGITERTLLFDWSAVSLPNPLRTGGLFDRAPLQRGARKPDDFSYKNGAIGEADL